MRIYLENFSQGILLSDVNYIKVSAELNQELLQISQPLDDLNSVVKMNAINLP